MLINNKEIKQLNFKDSTNFLGLWASHCGVLSVQSYLAEISHMWLCYLASGTLASKDFTATSGDIFALTRPVGEVEINSSQLYLLKLNNTGSLTDFLTKPFAPTDIEKIEGFFTEVFQLTTMENCNIYKHSSNLYNFLMDIMQMKELGAGFSPLVESAINIILEDYPFLESIEQLANTLAISVHHLIREFTQQVGESPGVFLEQVRLDRASLILRTTDYNLEMVANMVGYSSGNYFGKVFRKNYGTTPTQYRIEKGQYPLSLEEESNLKQLHEMLFF